jgi:hypothetical protein
VHRVSSPGQGLSRVLKACHMTGPSRLVAMEAVFISLMALVVLLSGYVSLVVLYKLFKAGS